MTTNTEANAFAKLRLDPPLLTVSDACALNDPRAIVFYHPDVTEIAAELCVRYPHDMRPGKISWGHFPDGWANIKFETGESIINRHIIFIMSGHKMNGFLEQICLLIALCRQFAKSVTIVMPYFGPATMERVSTEGELATAEPIFKLISRPIPPTCGGLPALLLVDIHDIRERFYPADNVTPKMLSAAELILPIIRQEKLTVVFPDEGAYKRFGNLVGATIPVVTFAKKRDAESREMFQGSTYNLDAYGKDHESLKNFIIWDDLVHSGGTLIECATALRNVHNSCTVQAFVTHAIFENDAHLRFVDVAESGIEHFYVTNTVPEIAAKLRKFATVFTVLDITATIAPFLLKRILADRQAPQRHLYPIALDDASALHRSVTRRLQEQQAYVYLSSASPLKRQAVQCAFPRAAVQSVSCSSQVPEQPWGILETLAGLVNRHNTLRTRVFTNELVDGSDMLFSRVYLVSIENGLIENENTGMIEDIAYIIVEQFQRGTNDYKMLKNSVLCGTVPQEHVSTYKQARSSDENLTFGKYLNLDADECADWSKSYGGSPKDRKEHIQDAIHKCIDIL